MTIVLEPPLAAISEVARPYPADMLKPEWTGLALFAAAFLGHNDAIHFARAGMYAECVDIDGVRLKEMAAVYPPEWNFYEQDAWEFARQFAGLTPWHVVSVDTFTGDATDRSLASLSLWCGLARHAVTATIVNGMPYTVPDGWRASLYPRSGEVSWLVLRR